MKKHAIIPIFIPHRGCPHDCIFCNQRRITARKETPSQSEIVSVIERNLVTIEAQGIQEIEVAYFGGSFTGLPIDEQNMLLAPAMKYKEAGRIRRIRLSTRPDYISDAIIENLLAHSVDAVELGAQSFDDDVLRKSNRGHTAQDTMDAFDGLKAAGFEAGLQLMSGLPGSSPSKDIASATTAARLMPSTARIYPTVILKDTALYDMYISGEYVPPTQSEMIDTVKQMYLILKNAGITILRVGLKSTDVITNDADSIAGAYHPAFRQLIEGSIAKDIIEEKLLAEIAAHAIPLQTVSADSSPSSPAPSSAVDTSTTKSSETSLDTPPLTLANLPHCSSLSARTFRYKNTVGEASSRVSNAKTKKAKTAKTAIDNSLETATDHSAEITNKNKTRRTNGYVYANPESMSEAAGHKSENRKYFALNYPTISLKYISDTNIKPGEYVVKLNIDKQ